MYSPPNTQAAPQRLSSSDARVNSHTEWDPLEEVIVGIADDATVPDWHVALKATMPERSWQFFRDHGGKAFDPALIAAANRDLDALVKILEAEGVTVTRPERTRLTQPFSTPDWSSSGGLYAAMPRDLLLVVGDEIIEAPMPWRSRYFEIHAYRSLLKSYFAAGARWIAAPRPQLPDHLYDNAYEEAQGDEPDRWVLNDFEPCFDAADFVRCGTDIFYFRSHTTNQAGATWLARHLGPGYRFHEIGCNDRHRMHIDTTFLPLAPGKVLVNPERMVKLPPVLRDWEALPAPAPCTPDSEPLYFSGKWLSMNILMLDERRAIVAAHEESLISSLRSWGFTPIPCPFQAFYNFGGSIHCATLDIRRRGVLQSYCL
jgi:glycine amidinotransferase